MLKDGVTMHSNDVDSLAKTLVKLCDSSVKRVLKRKGSEKSLYIAGYKCNALVHKKENFVDATEGSKAEPWNVTVEMVLPYTNDNNYYKVSMIVQCVMNACFDRVAKKAYQDSMLMFLGRTDTWTPADTKKYYESLWITSVWLLVTELCREELTPKRISRLSYSLFSDFMSIYQKKQAFPSDAVWKTYQDNSAASKGHNPPDNLKHYAGVYIAPTPAAIAANTPDALRAAALVRGNAVSAPKHVIPAAKSPWTPNSPGSAALPKSQEEQEREFELHMERPSTNLTELYAYLGFDNRFKRHPQNEKELACYRHWSELSKIPPTDDEWGAYSVIVGSTQNYPTVEAFRAYLPQYVIERKARDEKLRLEILELASKRLETSASRNW
jgi:hypothetical protein